MDDGTGGGMNGGTDAGPPDAGPSPSPAQVNSDENAVMATATALTAAAGAALNRAATTAQNIPNALAANAAQEQVTASGLAAEAQSALSGSTILPETVALDSATVIGEASTLGLAEPVVTGGVMTGPLGVAAIAATAGLAAAGGYVVAQVKSMNPNAAQDAQDTSGGPTAGQVANADQSLPQDQSKMEQIDANPSPADAGPAQLDAINGMQSGTTIMQSIDPGTASTPSTPPAGPPPDGGPPPGFTPADGALGSATGGG